MGVDGDAESLVSGYERSDRKGDEDDEDDGVLVEVNISFRLIKDIVNSEFAFALLCRFSGQAENVVADVVGSSSGAVEAWSGFRVWKRVW